MSLGRPVPTGLAVALLAAALVPAALAVASPAFGWLALALDVAVVALCAVDFLRAPGASDVEVRREVEPILRSGVDNAVHLELTCPRRRAPARRDPGRVPRGGGSPGAPAALRSDARASAHAADVHGAATGPGGSCASGISTCG